VIVKDTAESVEVKWSGGSLSVVAFGDTYGGTPSCSSGTLVLSGPGSGIQAKAYSNGASGVFLILDGGGEDEALNYEISSSGTVLSAAKCKCVGGSGTATRTCISTNCDNNDDCRKSGAAIVAYCQWRAASE
jgi:hypothetical protein